MKPFKLMCISALAGLFAAPGASAEDGHPPIQHTFEDGTILRFSGQINMGVLNFNDGGEDETYFVDNDNSGTRARLQLLSNGEEWKSELIFEVEYQPLASNEVSQLNDDPVWDVTRGNIRKAEMSFGSDRFGKFWFGQGSMASDGTAEVDKSGTTVIAYSSIADTAGGQYFRLDNGDLSDVRIKDAFSNFDGLSRKFRIRYDTPTYHGFGLRTSYGVDWLNNDSKGMYDIAGTYSGDFNSFVVDAAISYSRNEDSDTNLFAASISGLHKDSGISLTLAGGQDTSDSPTGRYGYAKLGYEHKFFDWGSTAFSVDYYFGEDIAAANSSNNSVGLAAVQNIDSSNLKLWLLWRNHHYDDDNDAYQDGQAIFGGALVKF